RHSDECLKNIERRVQSGEIKQPDLEQYRYCDCAWWVRGTNDYGKVIPRHSLKVHTWEAACTAIKKLNQPEGNVRQSLADAKYEWLAEKRLQGRVEPTITAYDLAARTLIDFMAGRKVYFVQDVTPSLLNQMRGTWEVGFNTHNSYRTQISTFFNFCVRM